MTSTSPVTQRASPPADRRVDLLFAALLVVMWSSGFIGAELGTRFAPAATPCSAGGTSPPPSW